MFVRRWWLRLHILQWLNAWRADRLRRTAVLLLWFVPCVGVPAVLCLIAPDMAAAALDWLLSLDIPLALALSAVTTVGVITGNPHAEDADWLQPASVRRSVLRALHLPRLVLAMRWPAGMACAALLLWLRVSGATASLIELWAIAAFAMVAGIVLAWLLKSRPRTDTRRGTARVWGRGMGALSWVPLRETRRHLDSRRISRLIIPLLLATPMGALMEQVLWALVIWVLLLHLGSWWREASRAEGVIRQWLPHRRLRQPRLTWYLWRYVAVATFLCALAIWLGSRVGAPAGAVRR